MNIPNVLQENKLFKLDFTKPEDMHDVLLYLEFHSIFCLWVSLRKPGLILDDAHGLTL